MRILEQRILRGPNRWADFPCLQTLVDFEGESCSNIVPEAIAELARALQRCAGSDVAFSLAARVPGAPRQGRIVIGFESETLACEAMRAALDVLAAHRPAALLAARMCELKQTARRHVLGARAKVLVQAAQARGIPAIRIDDEGDRFQLGWGKRQRKLHAFGTEPGTLDVLFGDTQGRIPVIAVTGTNGKTTTTLMIGHCARRAGMVAGVTTTEGVFIDDRQVMNGDCAGFHSARAVLTSPEVDIAVLETARGGILKRGLAFDRCTVGVVLNVSADHLGLDGVETIEQLADVKALVARSASGAAVLNADDPYCVAMAGTLRDQTETIYFSMDAANPVLLRHLASGGRAAWLEHGMMMLDDGSGRRPLMQASSLPASLNGHARYNIANALAAAAALMGAEFSPADIVSGLSSFVSDAENNPLRSNVYAVGEVTVIVDYAHNAAAYDALATMACSFCRGRRIALVTAPGDRRESDLKQLGRSCAAGFDEVFAYEADPRGRASGETAGLIIRGAQEGGLREAETHVVVPVAEAFAQAIAACMPGDVLIFACGSATTAKSVVEPYLSPVDELARPVMWTPPVDVARANRA